MAEEFQAAYTYSGSWWMSPRTACNHSSCSSDIANMENFGPFWPKDLMYKKSKSSDESSDDSMVFQDIQKPGDHTTIMSPDSASRMMATVFSDLVETTTTDSNHNYLLSVQEEMNTFSTSGDDGLKAEIEADHQVLIVNQERSLSFATGSNGCISFPISSTSYGYPSSLVQSLLSSNSPPQSLPGPPPPLSPPEQPLYDFQSNSNNLNFVQSLPKRQVLGDFHLTNNTTFSSGLATTLDHDFTSFYPSSYNEKEGFPNLTIEHNHQEILDLGSSTKNGLDELPLKRPRLETPSPLPTFKVRKEKLGDRITALQQLVSPFGKTDTASVLHEAIEYIKLLHDQVNVLSASYMKGVTKPLQPIHDKVKHGHKQDLRSLGLCLVPVSSTFPIATEMATGFWTPSYEGSLK
ncbi:putative transcription factor bHLH family [Helianthus annuus]|nr:putative transcription factor bHLH family [Helianthus annuus]